jgi:hypothetical protein
VIGQLVPIHRLEEPFDWAGEQEFHQAFIPMPRSSFQHVLSAIDALNVELLAGPDGVPLSYFSGENDVTFGGHRRGHAR